MYELLFFVKTLNEMLCRILLQILLKSGIFLGILRAKNAKIRHKTSFSIRGLFIRNLFTINDLFITKNRDNVRFIIICATNDFYARQK